jgi:cyclophilin family peptidyl-prolyl cis-trans isomerase
LLGDPSAAVRWRAAYALAGIQDPSSRDALREALKNDDDLWVRLFATRCLGALKDEPELQKPLTQSVLVEACQVARKQGEWQVAVESITALGNYPDLETAAFLIDNLLPRKNINFHVRAAAARSLGRFGSGGGTIAKALIRATTDPSRTVVGEAIVALGALGASNPAFASTARDILERTAENQDRFIRMKTVKALALMKLEGVDLLLDLARDESIRVRCACLEALSDPVYAEEREEIIPLAEEAVALDDMSLRYTGAMLLKDLGSVQSIPLLKSAFDHSPGQEMAEARLKIVEALDALIALAAQRGEAVDADFFRRAVRDPDYHVRDAAAKALASLLGELIQPAPQSFVQHIRPKIGVDYMTDESNPVAQLVTNKGAIWIERVYNKLTFHRVVSNFVAQGLDPRGDGWGFNNVLLRDEINRKKFLRGYVGMPNSGRDTGGCQIFITHVPTPHLDGNYTIFGRVIEGMKVVDAIEEGDLVFRINIK